MQLLELVTLTVFVEPFPLPEIITVVPPPVGDPLGDGVAEGLPEGVALGLDDGEPDGVAEGEPEGAELGLALGEPEGVCEGEGVILGEGLGKLAAAVNVLFILEAVSENIPKTVLLTIAKDRNKNTAKRKNVFLIVVIPANRHCDIT